MLPVTSPVTSLLLLTLPGIWLLGRAIASRSLTDRNVRRLLTPLLSLCLWLLLTHLLGAITHRFYVALWMSSLTLGVAGGALELRRRRHPLRSSTIAAVAADVTPWSHERLWMWTGAAVSVALIAPASLGWAFHDEINVFGHMSVPAEMLNGWYPPRHPSFPQFVLHYHFGFDLLTAMTTALLRVSVPHVIDLLTLALWGYAWLLLWTLGRRLIKSRWGALAAPLVMFGGGLPVIAESLNPACNACDWLGGSVVGRAYCAPPVVSVFFQHPWTLGLPVGVAALLVVFTPPQSERTRAALLALTLSALALSQTALFVALLAAIPASEAILALTGSPNTEARYRRLGWTTTAAVISLAGALVLPGALSLFNRSGGPAWFIWKLGPTVQWTDIPRWDLASYGLALLFGLLGFRLIDKKKSLILVILALGSIATVHLIAHRISWDIVKFALIAQLALGIGAAATFSWTWRKFTSIAMHAASLVMALILVIPGIAFCTLFFAFPHAFPDRFMVRRPAPISPADQKIATWLRRRSRPTDLVAIGSPRTSMAYASWAGLPQLRYSHNRVRVMLYPAAVIASRARIVQDWPKDIGSYVHQGVRWVVASPTDKHPELFTLARGWSAHGQAKVVFSVGEKRVYELLSAGSE